MTETLRKLPDGHHFGRRGMRAVAGKGASKYKAIRTEGLGPNGEPRWFDSKKEKAFADKLNAMKAHGEIVSWVPQVSWPCGQDEDGKDVRYFADAVAILEVRPDGTFVGEIIDPKGKDTPTSRAKRAALRSLYGLNVRLA